MMGEIPSLPTKSPHHQMLLPAPSMTVKTRVRSAVFNRGPTTRSTSLRLTQSGEARTAQSRSSLKTGTIRSLPPSLFSRARVAPLFHQISSLPLRLESQRTCSAPITRCGLKSPLQVLAVLHSTPPVQTLTRRSLSTRGPTCSHWSAWPKTTTLQER